MSMLFCRLRTQDWNHVLVTPLSIVLCVVRFFPTSYNYYLQSKKLKSTNEHLYTHYSGSLLILLIFCPSCFISKDVFLEERTFQQWCWWLEKCVGPILRQMSGVPKCILTLKSHMSGTEMVRGVP